ncbi:MAG: hypothetical protein IJV59_09010 [Eubacterium sp.]|nr:hypothetical protein [Eubacterium sp.]
MTLETYSTVKDMYLNHRNLLVAQAKAAGNMTDSEIASMFQVPIDEVAKIQEPEIVPVKNCPKWNDARLDGKWD